MKMQKIESDETSQFMVIMSAEGLRMLAECTLCGGLNGAMRITASALVQKFTEVPEDRLDEIRKNIVGDSPVSDFIIQSILLLKGVPGEQDSAGVRVVDLREVLGNDGVKDVARISREHKDDDQAMTEAFKEYCHGIRERLDEFEIDPDYAAFLLCHLASRGALEKEPGD